MPSCFYSNVFFLFLKLAIPLIGGCQNLQPYKFEKPLMGTQFLFICYAEDSTNASKTAQKAFDRIEHLNKVLSDYHPESEINTLIKNQKIGLPYKVSDDLWYMLNKSVEVSASTNGIFDITIGNCTKLWRRAKRKNRVPSKSALNYALKNTGNKTFELLQNRQAIIFNQPDVKFDFGGIAKGYAADEAFKVFKESGIDRVMVDAGGDIYCGTPPPLKKAWQVKIVSGLGNDTLLINLKNQAVATSGDLYRFFELDGRRYSHIINPKTCLPISKKVASTVVSCSAEKADYLASVANILGKSIAIRKIIKKYPESYIIITTKKPQKTATKDYGNKKIKKLING